MSITTTFHADLQSCAGFSPVIGKTMPDHAIAQASLNKAAQAAISAMAAAGANEDLSAIGRDNIRRSVATRALADLQTQVGPTVARLQSEAAAARASLAAAIFRAEGGIGCLSIARAQAMAAAAGSSSAALANLRDGIDRGDLDSVCAGLLFARSSAGGIRAAAEAQFARRFIDPKRDMQTEVEQVEVATEIVVSHYEALLFRLRQVADANGRVQDDPMDRLHAANDGARAAMIRRAAELGVAEQNGSTGTPSRQAAAQNATGMDRLARANGA